MGCIVVDAKGKIIAGGVFAAQNDGNHYEALSFKALKTAWFIDVWMKSYHRIGINLGMPP